jgi:hypothetical protein
MLRLVACISILALASPAAAVPCRLVQLSPKVMTPATTAIPSDGGVVVASWTDPDSVVTEATDDAAVQPTWRVRDGKSRLKPVIEHLAPGLAVYRLPRSTTELEDGKHAIVFTAKRTADAVERLPAPKIKSVKHEVYKGRRSSSHVIAEVAGAPPADAIALVIADAKKQIPRSWGVAAAGQIWVHSTGSCAMKPTGTLPTVKGERVVLFWVDAAGRKSEASKVFVVR